MSRPNYGLLSCAVILIILLGVVGGGVMGGVAGYYVVQNAAPAVVAQPVAALNTAPTTASVAPATTNLTLQENSAVIDAVRKVKPAVVTVINQIQTRRSSAVTPTASGSGIIIDPKGYIITNNHVVSGAQSLSVIYSDGTKVAAQIVGADTVADLAVLKVDGAVPAIAQFGDSNALEPGQVAIAIGSPLGDFRGTVTVGVISAMNRTVGNQSDLVQTDAAINNGNSGGPLINALGQVIGINTLVVRSTNEGNVAEGLGFAIPSNVVRDISNQLITKGKVERAYIGVSYQPVDPQIASALNLQATNGIVVTQVSPGSPAAKAGLQENDVILALEGQTIDQDHPLATLLFTHKVGETITLRVQRDSKTLDIQVVLIARPAS